MLATIPAALRVPTPQLLAVGLLSPARSTLALTWMAVLAGIVAVAMTLRASIAFALKRARFASAVTHELRTPLTTFRMYSEMLAEGMVTDGDQRQTYLETLRDESGRLSMIVENVLAYARLEEDRRPARSVTTTAADLVQEVVPTLRRRTDSAGLKLLVEADLPAPAPLEVDVEAVGQILFNLVDNACKYAADASDRTVHLTAEARDGRLVLCVHDHGPGVPGAVAARIFDAFDRGTRSGGDPTPGVGLGLALARGLARDMGGDLKLRPPGDNASGACFELTLPLG
jgi:signal transduction histidine kinase